MCTPCLNFEGSGIAIFTRKGTLASVLCGYRNDSHREVMVQVLVLITQVSPGSTNGFSRTTVNDIIKS